ncbi:MAG: hypothetical protein P9M07_04820 [Candidatus Aceula meridiana]|nr:hypothetical protein [Candidatus Aceula meridiana]
MKKLFIFLVIMLISSSAFAHPPIEMTLSYDMKLKTLTVSMIHVVSTNRNQHYIKEIWVTEEEGDPVVFNYRRQQKPREVIEAIPFDAKEGDTIFVKVYCSKGGIKKASIVIPENKVESKE